MSTDEADRVKRNVEMVFNAIDEIKTLTNHATINMAQAFMLIATEEGITVGEVQKAIGLPPTSTARAVSVLMKRARGRDGVGLVDTKPDMKDGRIKHLHLTAKGIRVWERMKRILDR